MDKVRMKNIKVPMSDRDRLSLKDLVANIRFSAPRKIKTDEAMFYLIKTILEDDKIAEKVRRFMRYEN